MLTACGPSARQILQDAASKDLNCPVASLQATEPASFVGHARGCDREAIYRWDGDKWISPLDRAAFELKCDKGKLTGKILDDRTFGITGCGHSVVYVLTPPTQLSRGEWVLNSDSRVDGEPKRDE
jgi:hypothetical protein